MLGDRRMKLSLLLSKTVSLHNSFSLCFAKATNTEDLLEDDGHASGGEKLLIGAPVARASVHFRSYRHRQLILERQSGDFPNQEIRRQSSRLASSFRPLTVCRVCEVAYAPSVSVSVSVYLRSYLDGLPTFQPRQAGTYTEQSREQSGCDG